MIGRVITWVFVVQVADAGAVPLLVLCAQEPELALKRVAASALSDMAKHTPELAQAVVDAGTTTPPPPPPPNPLSILHRHGPSIPESL